MSVCTREEVKLDLPRTGLDPFWQRLLEEFAADDEQRWKYLAMLALRENAGWQLRHIASVFGLDKGHVSRCLSAIKSDIRSRYELRGSVPVATDSACA